jgi:hypothetical protein
LFKKGNSLSLNQPIYFSDKLLIKKRILLGL